MKNKTTNNNNYYLKNIKRNIFTAVDKYSDLYQRFLNNFRFKLRL